MLFKIIVSLYLEFNKTKFNHIYERTNSELNIIKQYTQRKHINSLLAHFVYMR